MNHNPENILDTTSYHVQAKNYEQYVIKTLNRSQKKKKKTNVVYSL